MLTEWKLVIFIASCSSLLFPFILCSWINFFKALLSFPLEMLIFWHQKISSLWLHKKILIDYWMYYTLCPFSLAEQWQISLREGGNPILYILRGLVQAGSWQRHPLTLVWSHRLSSDSVDFLNFNFTASFTVSSSPGLPSFTFATLPNSGDKVSQLARCYRQVGVFWKFYVFIILYVHSALYSWKSSMHSLG